MGRTVTVSVPATSANLGPGFDSLGIALDLTGRVSLTQTGAQQQRPAESAQAMILAAADAVFARAGQNPPLDLAAAYEGSIPVGRGLGASAVLRVGAVVAVNRLLNDHFDGDTLLAIASEIEGHADNAAPALLGGFRVVVRHGSAVTQIGVPFPAELQAVLLVPDFEMPTEESRRLLPEQLSRQDAVHNIGRAALMVAALATGRLEALRVASQDVLHQPARARLFPGLYEVIDAAVAAGAACSYLSGGGSAVLALTAGNVDRVGEAMVSAAQRHEVRGEIIATSLSTRGAEITRDEETR